MKNVTIDIGSGAVGVSRNKVLAHEGGESLVFSAEKLTSFLQPFGVKEVRGKIKITIKQKGQPKNVY